MVHAQQWNKVELHVQFLKYSRLFLYTNCNLLMIFSVKAERNIENKCFMYEAHCTCIMFPSFICIPGIKARLQQLDGTWPLPRQRELPENWIGVTVSHRHV